MQIQIWHLKQLIFPYVTKKNVRESQLKEDKDSYQFLVPRLESMVSGRIAVDHQGDRALGWWERIAVMTVRQTLETF